jgi:hypothetical protein
MIDIPAAGIQGRLDLGIEVEKNVGGVEMGVLENGIPFLTQTGLATVSGAARATIFEISKEWEDRFADPIEPKGRLAFFKRYLFDNGYREPKLFIEIMKNGSPYNAYPEIVCMAVVEFFAFEAQRTNETALQNYRRFARYGLQRFIYDALQYTPPDKWKYFNDRVSVLASAAPPDHFILFHETTGMVVDLINANLAVNDKTIPDISVGIHWGKYWTANDCDRKFGNRKKYEHSYPSYYPQTDSNPQTPWAYPDAALPLFRKWFRNEYLPTKFPRYILTKANVLSGGANEAERITALFEQKLLGDT